MSIESLRVAVPPVVNAATAAEQAAAEERAAATELTLAILEIIKPAVRALGSRPRLADRYQVDGVHDGLVHANYRAIPLDSSDVSSLGPVRLADVGDENNGSYGNYDVVLAEDGRILQLSYAGRWSSWSGARCEWTATVEEITAEDLLARVQPETLAKNLLTQVNAAGDRSKATKAMLARAERYRAIVTLLQR